MIHEALKTLGPCLSSSLATYLVEKGLSPAAARQRISRAYASGEVKRLAELVFPHKARFIYLQSQYARSDYWENLFAAIHKERNAYSFALAAVQARGILTVGQFHISCGAPLAQKKHLSPVTVLNRLVSAHILVKEEVIGFGEAVMTKEFAEKYLLERGGARIAQALARVQAENTLLDAIADWAKKLAIVSHDKVAKRSETSTTLPNVGTFAWDLTAPSYISGLAVQTGKNKKPGFFVCDALLNGSATRIHVAPFLHKVQTLSALRNIGRTMFMLVAEHFEEVAFKELRSAGIIPATPRSLFGEDAANALTELISVLTKVFKGGSVSPEKIDKLLTALNKLEGSVGNMRGTFFELLAAELVRKRSPAEVQLNKICTGEDGSCEVDIYQLKEGVIAKFIECKGKSHVSDKDINHWIDDQIPRIRYHLKTLEWNGPLPIFELWTCGELTEASLERISKTKRANSKKYQLNIVGPEEISGQLKEFNDRALTSAFNNHYLSG